MVSIVGAVILKLALISPQINTWALFQAARGWGIVLLSDLAAASKASSVIPFHSHFLVVLPCTVLKCSILLPIKVSVSAIL